MIADIDKVRKGIALFVDNELTPGMDTIAKMEFNVAVVLLLRNPQKFLDNKYVKMFDIVDESGGVDIDLVREVALQCFPHEGLYIEIPVIDKRFKISYIEYKISSDDVEKLYTYIKEA